MSKLGDGQNHCNRKKQMMLYISWMKCHHFLASHRCYNTDYFNGVTSKDIQGLGSFSQMNKADIGFYNCEEIRDIVKSITCWNSTNKLERAMTANWFPFVKDCMYTPPYSRLCSHTKLWNIWKQQLPFNCEEKTPKNSYKQMEQEQYNLNFYN